MQTRPVNPIYVANLIGGMCLLASIAGGPVWAYGITFIILFILLIFFQPKSRLKPDIEIYLLHEDFTIKTLNTMEITLKTFQGQNFQIKPLDRKGKPAPVESGTVEYSTSNEGVATVEEDPTDETKFTIKTSGVGNAQINFSADANLGDEVETISGFINVTVTAEKAVTIEATATSEPFDLE